MSLLTKPQPGDIVHIGNSSRRWTVSEVVQRHAWYSEVVVYDPLTVSDDPASVESRTALLSDVHIIVPNPIFTESEEAV